ncbi:flavoprotein [Streptomyces sp. NPDC048565]|uniref:flavoprotein n=1 Tax=Streptomyces sp. NPDC048565 TaxID=3155266 RepID=UPI003441AB99
MSTEATPAPGVPPLGISRLLVVVTGSASASNMPFWLTWLGQVYPELETRVVVTRSAERFVTLQALMDHRGTDVRTDTWPADEPSALHVEWAEWAEAVLVYPATFHFLARCALGLADSPALLAIQCCTVPVVLAPALPPGGWQSPVCAGHVAALAERPNTAVVPPVPAVSRTTGRKDAWAPAILPEVLREVERLRERQDRRGTEPHDPAGAARP